MSRRWEFEEKEAFLAKLDELRARGVAPERLRVLTPYPVHEADELLAIRPSRLRFFTLAGAVTGLLLGFAFPILTVLHWPLVTGGKPLISIPPFVVIAFALTILLGALASFFGFLHLTRLPEPTAVREPEEHGNRFVITDLGSDPGAV
jgi:molybdopterin-containing oxidoreductase family membrane subunit